MSAQNLQPLPLSFFFISETPYESSKWACDLLSVAANDYFMQRQLRITSFTISPGVVSSRIGNFPLWILYLRTFLHYLVGNSARLSALFFNCLLHSIDSSLA